MPPECDHCGSIDTDVDYEVLVLSPDDGLIRIVHIHNLSVGISDWVSMWPDDIFFFARLDTCVC